MAEALEATTSDAPFESLRVRLIIIAYRRFMLHQIHRGNIGNFLFAKGENITDYRNRSETQ